MHAPLAVIGGGPGGYAAAFLAADLGVDVVLVDAAPRLGGTCLLHGCIPSKALLHVARVLSEVEELGQDWGVVFGQPAIDLAGVRARKDKVVGTLAGGLQQLAKRRGVRVVCAHARFQDANTLQLEGDSDSIPAGGAMTFDHAIIATGSAPIVPEPLRTASQRVMDSEEALRLERIPDSLLVVGGGYIGLELGTVYARLGSRVTIVEMADRLLPAVDSDLVKHLQRRLGKLVEDRLCLNTRVLEMVDRAAGVEVTLQDSASQRVEEFDAVLVAVGRRAVTQHLGLEKTRVQLDSLGFIQCDRQQRTAEPHILAVGDVAGEPMLAHKAAHQARTAIDVIQGKPTEFDKRAIPAVIFTDPEIAWAGLTEQQAAAANRRVESALFPWAASGRAQATGRTDGLTKWLIDPDSNQLVGCGIVGVGAGELISEAVLAIEMGCEVADVSHSVHPHPTLSETLMNAAEVFSGTALEIYKPRRR
ncbi:MAG: dihydrolipoyl dehydrogenase [Planctomycetaceae bacterium]|nr:dihydrolipoyl dehydrogenase [Planctomycetaceae bacterium]|tara:strand:+ start:1849 stop:3273 length:1425 start_codon:yes stop_codon:yes gene_type:complete